jgi:tryptophan synthase alpha subunit
MVEFLQANNRQSQLAKQIKPRSPFKANTLSKTDNIHTRLDSIDNINDLISEIESDKKGIPILIKQYLKLGGDILAFNVDDQFNNALDGLIMVDLLKTEAKTLGKYMGKEPLEQFHTYHSNQKQRA